MALTDETFRALQAYEHSKLSLSEMTAVQISDPVLAFAFCCLIILTALHLLQWFISNRIEKIASLSQ